MPTLFEACVDSVEAAFAAQEGGAQRVELCADLLEGGITPSSGAIQLTRQNLTIPMHVLIRPRGGDFCYSQAEFEVMKLNIAHAKALGADGIVSGVLKPDGNIDEQRTRELIQLSRPLSFTFHRAFDMLREPHTALETLVDLGADRLLTSGQEATAWEGILLLSEMVQQAQGRIIIMPAGGINAGNVGRIISQGMVQEVHASVRHSIDSPMQHRNNRVAMGSVGKVPEYERKTTSRESVQAIIAAIVGK